MPVSFDKLLVIVEPGDLWTRFADQATFEDDFVGLFFTLANDRSFSERWFNSALRNRCLFTYAKKKIFSYAVNCELRFFSCNLLSKLRLMVALDSPRSFRAVTLYLPASSTVTFLSKRVQSTVY